MEYWFEGIAGQLQVDRGKINDRGVHRPEAEVKKAERGGIP